MPTTATSTPRSASAVSVSRPITLPPSPSSFLSSKTPMPSRSPSWTSPTLSSEIVSTAGRPRSFSTPCKPPPPTSRTSTSNSPATANTSSNTVPITTTTTTTSPPLTRPSPRLFPIPNLPPANQVLLPASVPDLFQKERRPSQAARRDYIE